MLHLAVVLPLFATSFISTPGRLHPKAAAWPRTVRCVGLLQESQKTSPLFWIVLSPRFFPPVPKERGEHRGPFVEGFGRSLLR